MKILHNYIVLFILIVIMLVSLYFLSLNNYNYNYKYKYNESFTPHIRQMYRPHIRNARIYTEGFYNKHKNNINSLLRRFGIV